MIIFFLHGHINMGLYINSLPNFESLRLPLPCPACLFVSGGSSVHRAAAPTQAAPTAASGIHHINEGTGLGPVGVGLRQG